MRKLQSSFNYNTLYINLREVIVSVPNRSFLGKVILMNQLGATVIYWSIRSAQHVSGNILSIIRSVRLRYL